MKWAVGPAFYSHRCHPGLPVSAVVCGVCSLMAFQGSWGLGKEARVDESEFDFMTQMTFLPSDRTAWISSANIY